MKDKVIMSDILPEGEEIVAICPVANTVIVATNKRVFTMEGVILRPIKFRWEEPQETLQ